MYSQSGKEKWTKRHIVHFLVSLTARTHERSMASGNAPRPRTASRFFNKVWSISNKKGCNCYAFVSTWEKKNVSSTRNKQNCRRDLPGPTCHYHAASPFRKARLSSLLWSMKQTWCAESCNKRSAPLLQRKNLQPRNQQTPEHLDVTSHNSASHSRCGNFCRRNTTQCSFSTRWKGKRVSENAASS